MKRNIFLIIAFFSVLACKGQATGKNNLAHAGEKGIYIYNVFKPASNEYPDGDVTGCKLERMELGQHGWEDIGTYQMSATYPAFEEHFEYAKKVAFESFPEATALAIWTKYKTCHCLDSVALFFAYQVYKIAFNFILVDTSVKTGHTYIYRISQTDKDNNVKEAYTTQEVKFPGTVSFNRPLFKSRVTSSGQLALTWYSKNEKEMPKDFRVYRRGESENTFQIVHPSALITKANDSIYYSIADKDISSSELYYYVIAPTDIFGGGFNVHSDTIAATNYKLTDMMLPQKFHAYGVDNKSLVRLSWRVYKPAYVASIQVFRSEEYDKGYTQIGSAASTDTMYEDHSAHAGIKYFYYLKMTDKLSHQSERSVKVYGLFYSTRKPRVPFNLRVSVSEKGSKIRWSSDAKDIAGFYVSRCKGIEGKMQIISDFIPYKDTSGSFTDTSKLNPAYTYGYAIQQENASHVLSAYSKISYTQPKTHITLFAPKSLSANLNEKSVSLLWEDMRYQNPDMRGYRIFRKEKGNNDFASLGTGQLASQYHFFNDTNIAFGTTYEYAVSVVDINGNESAKSASTEIDIPAISVSAPAGLKAYDSKKGIVLQWNPSTSENVKGYHVFRYQRGNKPAMIADLPQANYGFTDTSVKTGELYFYYVTALQNNGTESGPCAEISIRGK